MRHGLARVASGQSCMNPESRKRETTGRGGFVEVQTHRFSAKGSSFSCSVSQKLNSRDHSVSNHGQAVFHLHALQIDFQYKGEWLLYSGE